MDTAHHCTPGKDIQRSDRAGTMPRKQTAAPHRAARVTNGVYFGMAEGPERKSLSPPGDAFIFVVEVLLLVVNSVSSCLASLSPPLSPPPPPGSPPPPLVAPHQRHPIAGRDHFLISLKPLRLSPTGFSRDRWRFSK
ncbi:hypothetical protein NHX12_001509 [Muraenolepis orangiensis]|uniref:Uncharacterized protein n=1 Tax=Muraenolepis orangiensis TaxID=630683 RepID=A0A9Q0DYK7_9TELE|nr:hypothetical protein NHX12_001509 [Muraenolepis orangiensis]